MRAWSDDGGRALVLGDAPGVEEGVQAVVDADAQLDGDGRPAGTADRGADDVAEQRTVHRQRRPAALAGDLGDRAAEVEVDVIGPLLADQEADGVADGAGLGAVELDRPDRLVVGEPGHAQRLVVALGEAAGGDHLAHEQPARLERAAQPAERRVGDARHGRQHHGWPHGERADPQRCVDAGPVDGHGLCAHRSVMAMPRSASSVRSRGRDRPITVPWSPSMPATNGAPYPSIVHPPATASGSPVAM